MVEKVSVIDKIEVLRSGHVQIRKADLIMEDDKEIAKTYHRHVLSPGDSTDNEDERVTAIANVVWTPEVISAYQATLEANKP